jgi:hypothetical protein
MIGVGSSGITPYGCAPAGASTRLGIVIWIHGMAQDDRIFLDAVGPRARPWMWASGHNAHYRRAAHGYEQTREAAMAAFAQS